MNEFTIRDIENLCGIKAHTLRIWEKRYQLHIPKRKAGNHRLYDNEDLKYLLRIAYLYHNGHKIAHLAHLGETEITQLALRTIHTSGSGDMFVNHLIEASLDFDQELFDRILHNIILHMGFEKAIPRIVYPFLQKIGLLWLTGNVVPAQEHFASALVTKKLLVAIHGLEDPILLTPKIVLLFTPKGEHHEIPLLYMRYLMKKNGIQTVYLGANVSLEALHHYCSRKPVTHLYFHLITNLLRIEPDKYVARLTELFPDKQIVISGNIGISFHYPHANVHILRTDEDLRKFATTHE